MSKLGGGSFQDGAYSAAFAYVFNEALHRYRLGPTRMCYTDQSGCTMGNALNATDSVSVPFTNNPVEGRMVIGPNNDPIYHEIDRVNYTITNYALEGHTFCCGQVVHSLNLDTSLSFSWSNGFYMREGIYLTTVGSGSNSSWWSARFNEAVGVSRWGFQRTHEQAPLLMLMRQYLK